MLLVILVKLMDQIPVPLPPPKRDRGHPKIYSDGLFLKALVIMIIRHLYKVHELPSILEQPTPSVPLSKGRPGRLVSRPVSCSTRAWSADRSSRDSSRYSRS
jgi:hypothetical protein